MKDKKLACASRGFTLVELLIVISLLGAIALIVIAAINPIEQANRARDTGFKADGGQLISAAERYFVAQSVFPWITVSPATYTTESAFGFVTAANPEVGICGTNCAVDGILIINNELKTEFRSRDFIQKGAAGARLDKQIMIGKTVGASSSVYACFVPLSKSVRQKAVAEDKVYTIGTSGTRNATDACDSPTVDWVTNACYVCIPQ